MWVVVIELLSKLGMSLLGTFFVSTGEAAKNAGVDSSALDYLYQLVESAETNSGLADGGAKYDWVFAQAVSYFKSRGIDMAIALLESLVQLAVHSHHATNGIAGKTVSTTAAP